MSQADRVRWRCRRGMRELDELLLAFYERAYPHCSRAEQLAFERLLEYSDHVLLQILLERMTPTEPELADVAAKIRRALIPAT